ncbi:hypothetical protein CMI47_19380 [Candidatus Pacearchaeota archaeon]|nr:hypothetical protein [Candidatus Pacearchaeota archaeon]|tara:strand:+ start:944 stop:1147 length:204 start_codon:yes stop_codon:yes gene_type:complete
MLNNGDLMVYDDRYQPNPWDGMLVLILELYSEPYDATPHNPLYRVLINGNIDVVSSEFLAEVREDEA